MPQATQFAHSITLDHIVLRKEEDESRKKARYACVILDIFTRWLQAYAAVEKTSEATVEALEEFLGPNIA